MATAHAHPPEPTPENSLSSATLRTKDRFSIYHLSFLIRHCADHATLITANEK
jgi:hypothetical protein